MSNIMAVKALGNKLNYIEQARIALQNQCRSLSETEFRIMPSFAALKSGVGELEVAEKEAIKELEQATKQHPLWSVYFEPINGCGPKSAGRLLALLGDPLRYTNQDDELIERQVSSLWHYCGYAPGYDRHKRGEQGSFNPHARKQLYVMATCLMKSGGHYKDVYDARKEATSGKVHSTKCMNTVRPVAGKPAGSNGCGTQANPEWGEIGAPWRAGHCHKDAIRIMMKTFLKDLYAAAEELELVTEVPKPTQAALALAA
jgi:hypothetical protein